MLSNNVELVTSGYTISVETAALGRVGERYVMRDGKRHQIALPLATETDHLREVWTAFLYAAASSGPMPAVLCGETVQSDPQAADPEVNAAAPA
jgi:hypothetical protein